MSWSIMVKEQECHCLLFPQSKETFSGYLCVFIIKPTWLLCCCRCSPAHAVGGLLFYRCSATATAAPPPLHDWMLLVWPSTGRRSSAPPTPPCRPSVKVYRWLVPTAHHRSGHLLFPCCCASPVMSAPTRYARPFSSLAVV